MKQPYNTTIYNTALYMRLSRDDELQGESGSIQTQRMMLRQYAAEHGLNVIDEYIDDGWSGTNFDRPDFQRMIDDIEDGKINCVVTKDLSRLGRNYILTGQYTEIYFPSKGVRYIAVNDNVDTINGENELAPFLNILNEMHARQTSKKVKAAMRTRFANGAHYGAYAPLGYVKDPDKKGHLLIDPETRCIGVLCAFLIMTYYSTVGGWCLTYLFEAIMGNAASSDLAMLEKTFLKTVSTPVSAILYQTLFLAITAGVLIFGVNKGIERMSKVLMPLLFVLMIVLIIRGLTLPGAWEGLKFLFSPKWDQVTANSLLNAMGFTFFSLSVGMGIMVTYGSYISHKENLTTTALWVSVLAFISCILAGLMVIPPVIAFGLNPSAGPGLTFITMPAVFSHIPLGDVFAVCFYGCLLVAALTSMISLFEVPLAYLMDEFHFSRKTASVLLFIVLSICSIPSALSMGPWADYKIMDKNIFDAIDFLCCNILMPLSAIFVVAMTGWFFFDRTKYEINSSVKHSDGFMKFFRFMLAFVAPCFIVVVAIFNLI